MGLFNKLLGNASEVSVEKLTEKYQRLLSDTEYIQNTFLVTPWKTPKLWDLLNNLIIP